jgi:hypothetical protein
MDTLSVIVSSNASKDDLKVKGGRIESGKLNHAVLTCVEIEKYAFQMANGRRWQFHVAL